MKISKQSRRDAKQLFRSCLVDGLLDENRARQIVKRVLETKPRGYLAMLSHFERLLKLDYERRSATVESAVPLPADLQAGVKTATAKQNVGIVREIGDGVGKIEGLTDAMLNEMLDFGKGVVGLALNLEETEVGAIILGDYTKIAEGDEVRTTGKLLQVPVGKAMLGRVVDALGQPVDGKGPIKSEVAYQVEKIDPGIIKRKSVSQPVQTGIMAVDAMIPIGRGQRELIIGDRSTGKTTIGVDTIISQARLNKAAEASGDKEYRPLY